MNVFDEQMKKRAKEESILVPIGFESRINEKINQCSAQSHKKRGVAKGMLVAAAVVALTTVTAIAAPALLNMAGGNIPFFESQQGSMLKGDQTTLEKFNSAVGASVVDAEITLTIDNLALSDNYITVFFTARSKKPIPFEKNQHSIDAWQIKSATPYLSFQLDGVILESTRDEVDSYLVDDRTIKAVQRISITQTLPERFDIELYTDTIFHSRGDWRLPLQIDKRAMQENSKTCTPGLTAQVASGWKTSYPHEITIDRVSISPLGGQITISEYVKAGRYFSQFALQDDKGKFLDVLDTGGGASIFDTVKSTNAFEFIGASADTRSITLIPLGIGSDDDGSPKPTLITAKTDPFPFSLKQSEVGEIVVDQITKTEECISVTYHSEGVVLDESNFLFFDANGNEIDSYSFIDRTYNRALGTHTVTYTKEKGARGDASEIKEIGIHSREVALKAEQSITIPLQ